MNNKKIILAAVGLSALGYFLYKKGIFSKATSSTAPQAPVADTKTLLKDAPTCPDGYKLQMVDINCNGQDCEVHCVVIPPVPERKEQPIVKTEPIVTPVVDLPFIKVPENPVIFYPYTDTPVPLIANPYAGIPQNPYVPVSDNSFKATVVVSEPDPFDYINTNYGKEAVNKELNQMLYR